MLVPELPVELLMKILDELIDERAGLKSCSLVSRAWRDMSHRLLFQEVAINTQAHQDAYDWVAQFLAIFHDPPLCDYIQKLSIQSGKYRRGPLCHHELAQVAAKLPNLRSITLDHVIFRCRPQCAQKYNHVPFVTNSKQDERSHKLDELTILGRCEIARPDARSAVHDALPSFDLGSLKLAYGFVGPRSMELWALGGHLPLNRFLAILGSGVQKLSVVKLPLDMNRSDFFTDLSICPKLQTLRIGVYVYSHFADARWDSLLHTLESIPPTLSSFYICCWVRSWSLPLEILPPEAQQIDAILDRLPALKSVVFKITAEEPSYQVGWVDDEDDDLSAVPDTPAMPDFKSVILCGLPRLQAKGILQAEEIITSWNSHVIGGLMDPE